MSVTASTAPHSVISAAWEQKCNSKLAWAFRAHKLFVESLSEETRERIAKGSDQSEAYVVVFGKTQVGKTTLMLDLMGLSGAALARVSLVLRGGREQGKSSTATAMEYRRSNTASWGLDCGEGPEEFLADSDMQVAARSVRSRMSDGQIVGESPIVVWIPSDCFTEGENTKAPSVRMLDLPGDNPADQVEREHVQRMAQKYVPHADLILLVGRGDDLSFLRPDALQLPSIEDWQIVPDRFRIVTTYSYTAQSVRDLLRLHDQPVTAEFFRHRLLEQIRTFGLELSEEAAAPHRLFPLEFGDSWVQAEARQKDLVGLMRPIVSELKQQLSQDIVRSTSDVARLRNAVGVHLVVAKVKQSKLKDMDTELEKVCVQLDRVQVDLELAAKSVDREQEKLEATQHLLESMPMPKLVEQVQNFTIVDMASLLGEVPNAGPSVNGFRTVINTVTSSLKRQFLNIHPSALTSLERKFWAPVQPQLDAHLSDAAKLIDDEFSGLRSRLSGYFTDEYYPSTFGSYSKDIQRLERDIRGSGAAVCKYAKDFWLGLAIKRVDQLSEEVRATVSHLHGLSMVISERSQESARLQSNIEKLKFHRQSFVDRMDVDEKVSRQFLNRLNEEYLVELTSIRRSLASSANPIAALFSLLGAAQIRQEREKIMIGIDNGKR